MTNRTLSAGGLSPRASQTPAHNQLVWHEPIRLGEHQYILPRLTVDGFTQQVHDEGDVLELLGAGVGWQQLITFLRVGPFRRQILASSTVVKCCTSRGFDIVDNFLGVLEGVFKEVS
jgi:hypothetical protein